jgi:Bacteriophage lambda head decoration protein D
MAAPIKSAAHIPATSPMNSPPRTMDFLLSDSVSHRSFEVIQIPQGAAGLWTGTLVDAIGVAAATPTVIAGILCYSTNPTDGPVNATVLVRDAEVIDAYLQYGALDPSPATRSSRRSASSCAPLSCPTCRAPPSRPTCRPPARPSRASSPSKTPHRRRQKAKACKPGEPDHA